MIDRTSPLVALINEDASVSIMYRLSALPTTVGALGTPYTQSSFSTITYSVFDKNSATPDTAIGGHSAASLTVSAVVYNTMQGWDVDSTGYNFLHTIAGTAFATGGHVYMVEHKYTLTTGFVGWTRAKLTALPVSTS